MYILPKISLIYWPHFSLSIFGPLWAQINLSIYVFEKPELPTAQSDMTLLDIGAAHFSRVEFVTEASFPFARDMASLARNFVPRARSSTVSTATGKNSVCYDLPGQFSDTFAAADDIHGNSDDMETIFHPVSDDGDTRSEMLTV